MLATHRREKLLIKVTGWPRLGFLAALFPTARFLHIVRDGRAVAGSLLTQPWWEGWRGPSQWRWGALTEDQERRWEKTESFAVLAGLQWEAQLDAVDIARSLIPPDQYHEIKYETMCADSDRAVAEILEFAGLRSCRQLEEAHETRPFVSANQKWRRNLTVLDQHALETAIAPTLRRWGYDADDPEAATHVTG